MRLVLPLLLLTVVSCSRNQGQEDVENLDSGAEVADTNSIVINDSANGKAFLAYFKEIKATKLHVYSPPDGKAGSKYDGKQLPKEFYHYFNTVWDHDFITWLKEDEFAYSVFGCYQFPFGKNQTALIVREPSQYHESAVSLYIWDNTLAKIIGSQELADAFGDEGWYFEQDSWLTDLNNDELIDIVTRRKDHDQSLDEPEKPAIDSDSLHVYINENGKFVRQKLLVDTAAYKLYDWD